MHPAQTSMTDETTRQSSESPRTREVCLRTVLSNHGIRCTRPRQLIYKTLCDTQSHPTAEELHHSVRAVEPGISLATIYNTLELLVDHGLARRIGNRAPGSGASRYDADQYPHLHLVLDDGRVIDAPPTLGKQLSDAIPEGLLEQLAAHAGVHALKIEIVEDSAATMH